jgi:hypothetical protein
MKYLIRNYKTKKKSNEVIDSTNKNFNNNGNNTNTDIVILMKIINF